jgi:hypothetical protein
MAARARTLAQVVGVETAARQRDNDTGVEYSKKVQSEALTTGHNHVYTPVEDPDEAGARGILTVKQPNSYKPVALTVPAALAEMKRHAVSAMDVVATKDATNQHANADIIINGEVLVPQVPVSHLLWLEKYFGEWRKKAISVLPVLNPTKNWNPKDDGIFESDVVVTGSFTKEIVPLELHKGTDKHPPQVQAIEKPVHVGDYAKADLSGAIRDTRKRELLDRCDLLIAAIKDAIARANQTPATEVTEGEDIFRFLLA